MRIRTITVGQLDVNCYIIADDESPEALVIDPGDEFERISELLDAEGLVPKYILFTHAHYDHVCAVGELKEKYGASLLMHEDEEENYRATRELCVTWGYEPGDFPPPDRKLRDGDSLAVGALSFEVLHTPGHTPGGICLYGEGRLFTGDTLFRGSIGRTDLSGGNLEKLLGSLKRLVLLPPETEVFSGHGEGTTIGREARLNPYLNNLSGPRFCQ